MKMNKNVFFLIMMSMCFSSSSEGTWDAIRAMRARARGAQVPPQVQPVANQQAEVARRAQEEAAERRRQAERRAREEADRLFALHLEEEEQAAEQERQAEEARRDERSRQDSEFRRAEADASAQKMAEDRALMEYEIKKRMEFSESEQDEIDNLLIKPLDLFSSLGEDDKRAWGSNPNFARLIGGFLRDENLRGLVDDKLAFNRDSEIYIFFNGLSLFEHPSAFNLEEQKVARRKMFDHWVDNLKKLCLVDGWFIAQIHADKISEDDVNTLKNIADTLKNLDSDLDMAVLCGDRALSEGEGINGKAILPWMEDQIATENRINERVDAFIHTLLPDISVDDFTEGFKDHDRLMLRALSLRDSLLFDKNEEIKAISRFMPGVLSPLDKVPYLRNSFIASTFGITLSMPVFRRFVLSSPVVQRFKDDELNEVEAMIIQFLPDIQNDASVDISKIRQSLRDLSVSCMSDLTFQEFDYSYNGIKIFIPRIYFPILTINSSSENTVNEYSHYVELSKGIDSIKSELLAGILSIDDVDQRELLFNLYDNSIDEDDNFEHFRDTVNDMGRIENISNQIDNLIGLTDEKKRLALRYNGRDQSFFSEMKIRVPLLDALKKYNSFAAALNEHIDRFVFDPKSIGIGIHDTDGFTEIMPGLDGKPSEFEIVSPFKSFATVWKSAFEKNHHEKKGILTFIDENKDSLFDFANVDSQFTSVLYFADDDGDAKLPVFCVSTACRNQLSNISPLMAVALEQQAYTQSFIRLFAPEDENFEDRPYKCVPYAINRLLAMQGYVPVNSDPIETYKAVDVADKYKTDAIFQFIPDEHKHKFFTDQSLDLQKLKKELMRNFLNQIVRCLKNDPNVDIEALNGDMTDWGRNIVGRIIIPAFDEAIDIRWSIGEMLYRVFEKRLNEVDRGEFDFFSWPEYRNTIRDIVKAVFSSKEQIESKLSDKGIRGAEKASFTTLLEDLYDSNWEVWNESSNVGLLKRIMRAGVLGTAEYIKNLIKVNSEGFHVLLRHVRAGDLDILRATEYQAITRKIEGDKDSSDNVEKQLLKLYGIYQNIVTIIDSNGDMPENARSILAVWNERKQLKPKGFFEGQFEDIKETFENRLKSGIEYIGRGRINEGIFSDSNMACLIASYMMSKEEPDPFLMGTLISRYSHCPNGRSQGTVWAFNQILDKKLEDKSITLEFEDLMGVVAYNTASSILFNGLRFDDDDGNSDEEATYFVYAMNLVAGSVKRYNINKLEGLHEWRKASFLKNGLNNQIKQLINQSLKDNIRPFLSEPTTDSFSNVTRTIDADSEIDLPTKNRIKTLCACLLAIYPVSDRDVLYSEKYENAIIEIAHLLVTPDNIVDVLMEPNNGPLRVLLLEKYYNEKYHVAYPDVPVIPGALSENQQRQMLLDAFVEFGLFVKK